MNNLAFHITDIVQNSLRANASEIQLEVTNTPTLIRLRIQDNGCGMDAATLAHATDPFYTTRTTRKVGLGLPFLIQNAEQTGGRVDIVSLPGKGTEVTATFLPTHIDCPPWGDLPETVALLITGNPAIHIFFRYFTAGETFSLSTPDLREALDDIPLSHPKVFSAIKDMIAANIQLNE